MKINWQAPDLTTLLPEYGVTTDDTLDELTSHDNSIASFTGVRNGFESQFKAIREGDVFRLFDDDFNEIHVVTEAVAETLGPDVDRLPTGSGPWTATYARYDEFHMVTVATVEEAIMSVLHLESELPGESVFTSRFTKFGKDSCQWGTGWFWFEVRRSARQAPR